MNNTNTTTFISTRAWVREKQLKEKQALKRRERLCNAVYVAKWVFTNLAILATLWATIWLWYFAIS
jgi:hypothetical protein|nr:MAG TPA: hypothetical protein [Caudoviricetes sp.]